MIDEHPMMFLNRRRSRLYVICLPDHLIDCELLTALGNTYPGVEIVPVATLGRMQ
jgi:hypothetical protein